LLGIETTEPGIPLLVRHWGLLLFLVGALLVYSAFAPAIRVPVMIIAIVEFGSALVWAESKNSACNPCGIVRCGLRHSIPVLFGWTINREGL
jgi:hypothetical protein